MNRGKIVRQMTELYNKRINDFIEAAAALCKDGWKVHMAGKGSFALLAVGNKERIVMLEAMPTHLAMTVMDEIIFRTLVTSAPKKPPQSKRRPKPKKRDWRDGLER